MEEDKNIIICPSCQGKSAFNSKECNICNKRGLIDKNLPLRNTNTRGRGGGRGRGGRGRGRGGNNIDINDEHDWGNPHTDLTPYTSGW